MRNRKRGLPSIERRDLHSAEKPIITDSGKIRGLAIPFNSWTTIGAGPLRFRERVAPSAVVKTLRESDLVYLDNHDPAKPISRKSAGTLEITVTDRGVEYLADPADTSYARDLMANIRAKNIQGNSFGFEPVQESWEIGADGVEERTLLEIKLPEISSCTFPAYGDTEIGMRDAYDAAMESRERHWHMLLRAKYSEAEIEALGAKGHAFKNPDGHYSYPIGDREDLSNAIHAVGRGGASHDAIRKYIIGRARAMGLSSMIPDDWASDGSVKEGGRQARKPSQKRQGMEFSCPECGSNSQFGAYCSACGQEMPGTPVTATKAGPGAEGVADDDYAGASDYGRSADMADEQRDDPDGHEVAAMHLALASIAAGDRDKARQILEDALRVNGEGEADDDGLQCNIDHSSGKVQVPRAAGDQYDLREIVKAWAPDISKAYDIVRSEFPAIDVTNKVLNLLHPFVSEISAEEREKPKPESSTSEIAAGSDAGIALDLRFRNTQSKFRL